MHAMVDIETLGTRPGCMVLSIGAVRFDENGADVNTFYRTITASSQEPLGLRAEGGTLDWWLTQSPEAIAALRRVPPVSINQAMHDFDTWWKANRCRYFWCHGATFDEPIINRVLKQLGWIDMPWKFYDVRDTRTLYHLSGIAPQRDKGTHHDALADAQSQAVAAVYSLDKLGWPAEF